MFTGIVIAIGTVLDGPSGQLAVWAPSIARQLVLGGSVAVNGCCLTMVDGDHDQFRADVVPETLRRTNLGTLRPGAPVNLELPATVQTLLDGHLVQGHIDATTEVIERVDAADSSEIIFRFPAGLERLIAEKGSIAIDGTSLTVAEVDDGRGFFRVAVIPTTLERTVAGTYSAGSVVNVEVDVIARYTQRLLGVGLE